MSETLYKNWINMFDAIFYINMKKSFLRRQHIESEFSQFTGDLIRVNATTPDTLGIININDIVNNNAFVDEPYRVKGLTKQNQNEISLSFSHADALSQAIEYFKSTGKSKILIIEDDAVIQPLDQLQKNKLSYVHQVGIPYDIWQLGYTIFKENCGSWLTEREYAIKCKALTYGVALAEKGIFGTLGYAINLSDDNIPKFEKFIHELRQGSISDYCLSEQSYLRKIIWEHKLLMPLQDQSTISDTNGYSVVEAGYKLDAFDEGFVQKTSNYNQSLMTCYRENHDSRMAYLIIEHVDKTIENWIYIKSYFTETTEDIIIDAKSLYNDELQKNNISKVKRAYVVIFDNLSKPNLGKRIYIKQ